MLETKAEVEQFLVLQQKSELELRAICEGMQLDTPGSKDELLDRLLSLQVQPQRDALVAQAIPLRTRDENQQPIEAAIQAMRQWRKLIFEGKDNLKEFKLLTTKGKQYTTNLRYFECGIDTLNCILENNWYLPLDYNKDLIQLLKSDPSKFNTNIVQKSDGKGNSWIMLHVEAA